MYKKDYLLPDMAPWGSVDLLFTGELKVILYLKFKLSNQNIVFLPRDEVISHCISLLKWDTTKFHF